MIRALASSDSSCANLAIGVLGHIGDARAVQPLIDLWRETDNLDVILALSRIGTPEAMTAVDSAIPPGEVAEIARDFRGNYRDQWEDHRAYVTYLMALDRHMTVPDAVDLRGPVPDFVLFDWARGQGLEGELNEAIQARRDEAAAERRRLPVPAPESSESSITGAPQ